jgi:predicted Zn-dependent peptidase
VKKFIFVLIILLEGVLVSSSLESVKIGSNSVPLIYEEDKNLPIVTMQLVFQNSGSLFDGKKTGIANMSAKLLNEGTKKLGSVGFATALEDNAIHLGVDIGRETLVIELSALKEKFGEGVKLLKSLLLDPNLSEDTLNKVKLLTKATLERKESDFDYLANRNLYKILYKDTPLANPSLGTMESVSKIKLDDIKEFIKEHLILDEAIAIIGGDLDNKEAKTYAKDVLEVLKNGKKFDLPHFKVTNEPKRQELKKQTKQAYVYFGAPYSVDVNSSDRYISKVAMFILGSSGFGSRMMEEIRVKNGLAYSAYSRANIAKSHSEFFGYLQTKLESQEKAIKLVKEVIEKFTKEGATKEELKQAKRFLLGSEPLRNETLSQRLSRAFHEYYEGFKLGHSKEELEKIEKLSLDELNSFVKSHKEINNLSFSIVTDKK